MNEVIENLKKIKKQIQEIFPDCKIIIEKENLLRLWSPWFCISYSKIEKLFGISFNMESNTSEVAFLTKLLIEKGYKLGIFESYYISEEKVREDKKYIKIYWGEKAKKQRSKELEEALNEKYKKIAMENYVLQNYQIGGEQ